MRFAWVGFHPQGLPALDALLDAGAPIRSVFTLRPDLAAARHGGGDYVAVCERHGVPLDYVSHIDAPATVDLLRRLDLDVLFVIGWPQVARGPVLRTARLGVIGSHLSLLPHNRGGSPLTWTLMRGERVAGTSLLWLSDDLLAGDIIDQTAFPVTPYDTSATLYDRAAASTRDMLLRLIPRLLAGERPDRPQSPAPENEPPLRRRTPADCVINWTWPAARVYDLIRALTRPHRGACSQLSGVRRRIWTAALPPGRAPSPASPGVVLGPVVSPTPEACGQLVACGEGAVILLEVETEGGELLRGAALSEQQWTDLQWEHD